ncbi:hypothetical protein Hanom_Chr11g01061041 [Helianthus anomalus]
MVPFHNDTWPTELETYQPRSELMFSSRTKFRIKQHRMSKCPTCGSHLPSFQLRGPHTPLCQCVHKGTPGPYSLQIV